MTKLKFGCTLVYIILILRTIFGQPGKDMPLGSPIRPYNVIPESFKLIANISDKVMEGRPLTMWATLSEPSGEIVKCQWTSPFGVTYTVDKDTLMTAGGKVFFYFLKLKKVFFTEFKILFKV